MLRNAYQKTIPLLLIALLAGCGGSGGSSSVPTGQKPVDTGTGTDTGTGNGTGNGTGTGTDTGTGNGNGTGNGTGNSLAPLPADVPAANLMTMSCVSGATQCSGDSAIRTDNGVTLTNSGVQVYGRSTSDLANPNPNMTASFGLGLATGGLAEVRVAKAADGTVSNAALLLDKMGLSWDAKTERPKIVETFNPTQGRTVLNADGTISSIALPASSDVGFFDFAAKGVAGTQANYANNRYFPRTEASRCTTPPCATTETAGLQFRQGDWRTGGNAPDNVTALRLHGDGDIHAGSDANGAFLPGGDGIGLPVPGTKGYRGFDNWGLQYSNLSVWESHDTVEIAEWSATGANEHNTNRRGLVAYGDVTAPSAVPSTGTATYTGILYGWYTANGATELKDPATIRGTATLTVNFATRQVVVTMKDAATYEAVPTAVPVNFTATIGMGAAGANVANYMNGAVDTGTLKGGLSGRYFGPVVTTGTSGAGPAEIAGTFSLSGTGGAVAIGGFIGRKQ